MYKLIIKLMVIAAILKLGISIEEFAFCHSKACSGSIEKASREVLKIDWKPISIFPEVAQRFR
jgi:hypothetical protein